WQKAAYASGGLPEMNAVSATLAARFPDIAAIKGGSSQQIHQTISEYIRASNFDKALEFLKAATPQLSAADLKSMNELIYDNWAKRRMEAKDWPGAADIYFEGLAAAGSSDLLRNNAVYLVQEWAKAGFASGGVDGVIPIARLAATKFPNLANVG